VRRSRTTSVLLAVFTLCLFLPVAFSFTFEEKYDFCEPVNITFDDCLNLRWDNLTFDCPDCSVNTTIINRTVVYNVTNQTFNCSPLDARLLDINRSIGLLRGSVGNLNLSSSCPDCEESFRWLQEENRHSEEVARIDKGLQECPDTSGFLTQDACDVQISDAVSSANPPSSVIQGSTSPLDALGGSKRGAGPWYSHWVVWLTLAVGGFILYKKLWRKTQKGILLGPSGYQEVEEDDTRSRPASTVSKPSSFPTGSRERGSLGGPSHSAEEPASFPSTDSGGHGEAGHRLDRKDLPGPSQPPKKNLF
jgi:hypothetical protein